MQYPHTWIVWVYTQSVHSHITIQEMSAVRLSSCFENCQIFYLGLRKHFLYVCFIAQYEPLCHANLDIYFRTSKENF